MARAPRRDTPGSWHHVTSRGASKRTIFECRDDFHQFLSLLAKEVREGTIEVHSYSLMQTHYHLMVRSPLGKLSFAMGRTLREYSRWFNHRRRRTGALFSGRFKSKPVDHHTYQSVLVRYIDDNPIKARMAPHAAAYPYGSAVHYAQADGPQWLERTWIERETKGVRGRANYAPEDYFERFPTRFPDRAAEWCEPKLSSAGRRSPEPDGAQRAVANRLDVSQSEARGRNRTVSVAAARAVGRRGV